MGDDNKVLSVKVKRGDGSVQIHSIKLMYPLKVSLTHAYHPGTVPSSEAAGNKGADNSDESRESPYAVTLFHQRPKRNKNLKEKRNSPNE